MSECTGTCSTCGTKCDFGAKSDELIHSLGAIKNFNENIDSFYQELNHPYCGVVNITNSCNNRCPYCFVCFENDFMDLSTAEQVVKFLKENGEKSGEKPTFTFFGGEPLLAFDTIIKPIILKYKKELNWSITTNGTLLTEEIIDFLADNDVSILLSFDGIKEVQDKQRPLMGQQSSFDKIMKSLDYLVLKIPDTVFRGTLTKFSIPYLYQNMLFFEKIGAKSCAFCIDETEEYDEQDFLELKRQLTKCGLYIYKKLMNQENVIQFDSLINAAVQIKKIEDNPIFGNDILRCGLGTTSIGITFDGKLMACQEENSISSSDAYIGDVFNGINKEKHKKYLLKYWEIIEDLSCNKPCDTNVKMFCFNSQCPNQIIKNGKISVGKCIYNKAIHTVGARFNLLLRDNIRANVREYFGGEL